MKRELRVGTRGSELALVQTRWVCDLLRNRIAGVVIEEAIIATHGDAHASQPVTDEQWPMGGFTSAIERALLAGEIDFAVHSLKDLPVQPTPGTKIAAIPVREAAHDVLITATPISIEALPAGMRIGTSSPRRAAQIRRLGDVETVPLRGNVPTRIARVGNDLDGVILAAAGVHRLAVSPPYTIDLPIATFLPAPGQGALAVQGRDGDEDVVTMLATIDDEPARLAATAERALLAHLGGGCSAPVGAHATIESDVIHLRGQVFSPGGEREASGEERGGDPDEVAHALAHSLKEQLAEVSP